jgi:hypothetical protein
MLLHGVFLWIELDETIGKGWTIACGRCKGKMVELGGWLCSAACQAISWGRFGLALV